MPSRLPGLLMAALALLGGAFLLRFLRAALTAGVVTGRSGDVHAAWSASYTVAVLGCVVGLGFVLILVRMGLQFAGVLGPQPSGDASPPLK